MLQRIFHRTRYETINRLLNYAKMDHPEYDSAALYGDSEFIMNVLKEIIINYPAVKIASLDIILYSIDPVPKDLYILEINSDLELFIQSAWNGNQLFLNEFKAVMCREKDYNSIVNVLDVEMPIEVFS